MNSMLKITMKNLWSKKGRTLMLVLSVVLSAGLVYAVLNMSVLTEDVFMKNYQKEYGQATVLIHNEDMSMIEEDIYIENASLVVKSNQLIGYSEFESLEAISMMSFSLDDLETLYAIEYVSKSSGSFTGSSIIVGQENAEEYDLAVGDTLFINILGQDYEFTVYGIVMKGTSYLDQSLRVIDTAIPQDFVEDQLGITTPNIVLTDLDSMYVEDVQNRYESLEVVNIYNQESLIANLRGITVPLTITACSVVLVSAFIIFTTYRTIVIERLGFVGTLRSIGASKKQTTRSLLLESVLVGFLGGLFGIIVGIGFLLLMFQMFFSDTDFSSIDVEYFQWQYALFTVLTALLLSVLSSILPIIKINKYTIKQVMFQDIKNNVDHSIIKYIVGLMLVGSAFLLVQFMTYETEGMLSSVSLLLLVIGLVLIIPLLIVIVIPVVQLMLRLIFGQRTKIAMKNIKNDKTLLNNITLLSIGLAIIFTINNFSRTVGEAVEGVYNKAQFDIAINDVVVTDEFHDQIITLDGVDTIYQVKEVTNITTLEGYDLMYLHGIDIDTYDTYAWDTFTDQITSEQINTFKTSNSIIISNFIANKYDLKEGDLLHIPTDRGVTEFTIIATISNIMYNGNMTYINQDVFTEQFDIEGYQNTFINTSKDPELVKQEIKQLYPYGVLFIETLDDMEQTNTEGNNMIFSLMKGISFLAMFIGAVGIINNFVVSFVSRRKLIASLRSLGLSKQNTVVLFSIEAIATGLIGGLLAVGCGVLIFHFLGYVIASLNITTEVLAYSVEEMVFVFISAIVLSLVSSLLPGLQIVKQNIVKEIKYE